MLNDKGIEILVFPYSLVQTFNGGCSLNSKKNRSDSVALSEKGVLDACPFGGND
jgi:hypothetical protein